MFYNEIITVIFAEYTYVKIKSVIKKVKDIFMQFECYSFQRIREEELAQPLFYSMDFNNSIAIAIISLLL